MIKVKTKKGINQETMKAKLAFEHTANHFIKIEHTLVENGCFIPKSSSTTAPPGNNISPAEASSPNIERDHCFMPGLDDKRQWTSYYGYLHWIMQCISITPFQSKEL